MTDGLLVSKELELVAFIDSSESLELVAVTGPAVVVLKNGAAEVAVVSAVVLELVTSSFTATLEPTIGTI